MTRVYHNAVPAPKPAPDTDAEEATPTPEELVRRLNNLLEEERAAYRILSNAFATACTLNRSLKDELDKLKGDLRDAQSRADSLSAELFSAQCNLEETRKLVVRLRQQKATIWAALPPKKAAALIKRGIDQVAEGVAGGGPK